MENQRVGLAPAQHVDDYSWLQWLEMHAYTVIAGLCIAAGAGYFLWKRREKRLKVAAAGAHWPTHGVLVGGNGSGAESRGYRLDNMLSR